MDLDLDEVQSEIVVQHCSLVLISLGKTPDKRLKGNLALQMRSFRSEKKIYNKPVKMGESVAGKITL